MVGLLLAGLLAAAASPAVDTPWPHDFHERMFDGLNAERVECRRPLERKYAHATRVECGYSRLKTKQFLGAWTGTFPDDAASVGAASETGWVEILGGWIRRYYEVEGVPTVVAYGGRQRGLVVADFVTPRCDGADSSLPWAGTGGTTRPKRVDVAWAEPSYPQIARRRLVDGMVLLRAIVDRDGRPRSLCVLDEWPEGYGFAAAALEEAETRHYEPATRDGAPVEVQLGIATTFQVN